MMMMSWTAVAVMLVVMTIGSRAHDGDGPEFPSGSDLDMLVKRAQALGFKQSSIEGTLQSFISSLLAFIVSLGPLDEYAFVSFPDMAADDGLLASDLEDELQTFYDQHMAQTMATASLKSRVDLTKNTYKQIVEEAQALLEQYDDQYKRACDVEFTANERCEEMALDMSRMVQHDMDKVEETTELLSNVVATQTCKSYLVTINVTDANSIYSVVSLNITDDFLIEGMILQPSVYCAMTGLVSTINEPVRYSEEYDGYTGFLPSNREYSSFELHCEVVAFGGEVGVFVSVLDMSGSARGEDVVSVVTVEVKACSFPPLSMVSADADGFFMIN